MKVKTFVILLVAAGVLVALVYLRLGSEKQAGSDDMGETLFAELPVNTVARIIIADTDNKVTLTKGENFWQVQERNGYPADFDELRDTVVKLSRLKIGRSFTSTDDSLKRLSLMPPSTADKDAGGTQISLVDAAGKTIADVILGQTRKAEGGGSGGQYLKTVDGDTVYLVDNNFRFLKTAPAEWLRKEILDIKSDLVSSVTCYAGDNPKPVYTLQRPEKGKAVQVTPVPEGREADASKIDQVMDALSPLSIDDVAAADGSAAHTGHRLVYSLLDGREITILPAAVGGERYTIRVVAAGALKRAVDDAEKQEASAVKDDDAENAAQADDAATSVKTSQEINRDLGPWVFSIKKWQFDSFITQPDGLLNEVEDQSKS
ncbi:MAG: hypothetical protein CR984_00460 [Proteobacteria bacterium]|nr:MAG: hypothetical protein CR984_00460 [Pseudomonadota bacterium]